MQSTHVYELRPRKDHRAVNLISDALPFGPVRCEQIHEQRLVGIAHRRFAVWQNPFGILSPEIVMNLPPEICDCVGYSHRPTPGAMPRFASSFACGATAALCSICFWSLIEFPYLHYLLNLRCRCFIDGADILSANRFENVLRAINVFAPIGVHGE